MRRKHALSPKNTLPRVKVLVGNWWYWAIEVKKLTYKIIGIVR